MLSSNMTIAQAFREEAAAHPNREALVCGSQRLTYGELAAQAETLAGALARLGVGPGERVATLLPPGWPFVALFLAVAGLGAVLVPLNPPLRRRQLAQILMEVEPAALAVGGGPGLSEMRETAYALVREALPGCRLIAAEGGEGGDVTLERLLAMGVGIPGGGERPASPDDLALILYTSGTTGSPKGVMHSHRGLIAPVVASMRLRRMWLHRPSPAQLARMAGLVARYGMRLLQAAGQPQTFLTAVGGHAIAGIEVLLQVLLMGDRLVLMQRFHPRETLRAIETERVTILVAAPLALSLLVRMDLQHYDLSSLLIVGTGSAPCPPDLARQVQQCFGCAVHIGYGTTEVGGGISATSVEDSAERQAQTVGRPMAGIEVRIVDEERRPLGPGQVGELACRGEGRMLGYYRAPELSHEVVDEDGWYYTGDLAVMDEQGFIRIVDRKKDVIIRGGQNIYPAEIERYLAAHARIREAAVVGVPTPAGDERVWAFVLLEEGVSLSAQDVLSYCREALEPYRVPDQVRIVGDLPRSALGKVRKSELRAQAEREMRGEEKDHGSTHRPPADQ